MKPSASPGASSSVVARTAVAPGPRGAKDQAPEPSSQVIVRPGATSASWSRSTVSTSVAEPSPTRGSGTSAVTPVGIDAAAVLQRHGEARPTRRSRAAVARALALAHRLDGEARAWLGTLMVMPPLSVDG